MSLTDDWKAEKLNSGWYFCKLKNGSIHHFEFNGKDFTDLTCHIAPVAEVLSPCDYDYISELQSKNKHLLDLQANQDKEVEKIRKLLWECKDYIDFCSVPEGFGKSYIAENLLTRINEALGNDK